MKKLSLLFSSLLRIICLCFLLCGSYHVFSQTTPFVMISLPPETAALTEDEQAEWNAWAIWSYTQSIQLVQMTQGALSPSEDEALVSLPGTAQPILAKGAFTGKSSSNSVWMGQIQGSQQQGTVTISTNGSFTGLLINQPANTRLLLPISTRYNALITINSSVFTYGELPFNGGIGLPETGPDCGVFDNCQKTVLATVILTPEAISTLNPTNAPASSMQAFAANVILAAGLQTINFALLNSGVIGKYVRFEVVHDYFPLNQDSSAYVRILNDLFGLKDPLLGSSSSYSDVLREKYNSDIVILLTNDRYGPYAGIGDASGVAIVSVNNLLAPRYTFAHELGHVFGADHNRKSNGGDADDVSGRCNYGYSGFFGASVMCTLYGGGTRQLRFSNPYMNTGTQWDNNAGFLSGSMCDKPFYRNRQEASLQIIGPSTVCSTQNTVTFTANITPPAPGSPGTGPYTYRWFVSAVPSSPYTTRSAVGSTDPVFTFDPSSGNIPTDASGRFWVYLTVTTGSMVILTDAHVVTKVSCNRSVAVFSSKTASGNFMLTPNPSTGRLTVAIENEQAVGYIIRNACGQAVKEGDIPAFQRSLDLDLEMPAGMYYFTLTHSQGAATQRFIIQR